MKSIDPGITGRSPAISEFDRDHPTEAEIQKLAAELSIELGRAYRPAEAYPYLGYKHTQAAEKVKSGEIEPPLPLSESGNAVAWLGRQLVVIIWRRLRMAAKRKQIIAA
jgi:hypothetical protein